MYTLQHHAVLLNSSTASVLPLRELTAGAFPPCRLNRVEAAPTVVPVGSVPATGVTTHSSGQAASSTSSMFAQGADAASDTAEDHHSSAVPDDQVAFHHDDISSITSTLVVTAVSACQPGSECMQPGSECMQPGSECMQPGSAAHSAQSAVASFCCACQPITACRWQTMTCTF